MEGEGSRGREADGVPGTRRGDARCGMSRVDGIKTNVYCGSTEAGAAIEPVIISKLVDLDTLLIRRLMRHRLCRHRQRLFGLEVGRQATAVLEEFGREVEVLLEREFGVGLTEEGERGQLFDLVRALGHGRARDSKVQDGDVRSGLS